MIQSASVKDLQFEGEIPMEHGSAVSRHPDQTGVGDNRRRKCGDTSPEAAVRPNDSSLGARNKFVQKGGTDFCKPTRGAFRRSQYVCDLT